MDGDSVRFEVADSGKGISPQVVGGLFDAHNPAGAENAETASGIGIGLSICKTIIEAHGGTITGANRAEGGALFCVTLPLRMDK